MKLVDTWVKFTARVPDTMTCVVHQSCSWGKKGVFLTLTVPPTACSPPMTQRAQGLKDVIWLSPSVSRSSLVLWVLSMILQAPVGACKILVDGRAEDSDECFPDWRTEGANPLEGCAQVCFACSQVARRKFGPGAGRKSPRTVPFCPCHIFLSSLQLCLTNPALLHFVPQP